MLLAAGCSQTIPGVPGGEVGVDRPAPRDDVPTSLDGVGTDAFVLADTLPGDEVVDNDVPTGVCEERPSEVDEVATSFVFLFVRTRGGCIWRWRYDFGTVVGAMHVASSPEIVPGVSAVRSISGPYPLFAVVGSTARAIERRTDVAPVPAISDAIEVASGSSSMCALVAGQTVRCTGDYGTRDAPRFLSVPTPVEGVRGATRIAMSVGGTVAILVDGTVATWDADFRTIAHPTLTGVIEIATSEGNTCMRFHDGSVRCAGHNRTQVVGPPGQDSVDLDAARPVAGVTDAVGVATAHGGAAYALRADGRLVRWGRVRLYVNMQRPGDTYTPELVPDLTDVVRIGGGTGDLLAVRRDGTLWSLHLPTPDGVPTLARVAGFGPP